MEVDGDLKVTGTIQNDSLVQVILLQQQQISALEALISQLQVQIALIGADLGYADCFGVVGGGAAIDDCCVCGGNNESMDICGECGGNAEYEDECNSYALQFNGNINDREHVNVTINENLGQNDGILSISLWINFDSFDNLIGSVISNHINGSGFGIELYNSERLAFWVDDGINNLPVATNYLEIDTWYHIVATNNGEYSIIYLNGQFQDSIAVGSPFPTSSNMTIGMHPHNNIYNDDARFMDGNLDEIAIWNDVLDQDEILKLYNNGVGMDALIDNCIYTSSENLWSYWKFEEGSGETIFDSSENGNHGILNNMDNSNWIERE